MTRSVALTGAVLLLALYPSVDLEAQLWNAGPPGEDVASVGLLFGTVQPQTTFRDGSVFESGAVVGASVAAWAGRFIGFRANLVRGQTDGRNDQDEWAAIAVNDPTIWLYSGEVVLRYPMGGGDFPWFPFLSGGIGGKTYQWAVKPEGDTATAYTVAGGFQLRPRAMAPFGLMVEARNHRSDFRYFGHAKHYDDYTPNRTFGSKASANDLVLTAGITANF